MLSDLVVKKLTKLLMKQGVKLDIEQDGTIFIGAVDRYDKSCS